MRPLIVGAFILKFDKIKKKTESTEDKTKVEGLRVSRPKFYHARSA